MGKLTSGVGLAWVSNWVMSCPQPASRGFTKYQPEASQLSQCLPASPKTGPCGGAGPHGAISILGSSPHWSN